MRVTHISARQDQSRKHRLLLAAGLILTIGAIPPTLDAANCSAEENRLKAVVYSVKRVLPFLGDRCVQVKPTERKSATPVPDADPSQNPTALPGDPR